MNNNINLPGFEELIIRETKMIEGTYQIHLQVERKPHSCPACHHLTDKIHDYRIQKILSHIDTHIDVCDRKLPSQESVSGWMSTALTN